MSQKNEMKNGTFEIECQNVKEIRLSKSLEMKGCELSNKNYR